MTPAANPLRISATALLTSGPGASALLTAGVGSGDSAKPWEGGVTTSPDESPAFPYVEVQGTTEVESQRSDTTRQSIVTLTLAVRSTSRKQAEAIGQALVDHLGRRFGVPGFQLALASLDLYGPAYREPPPGARAWSLPVRFRYVLFQPADPGE